MDELEKIDLRRIAGIVALCGDAKSPLFLEYVRKIMAWNQERTTAAVKALTGLIGAVDDTGAVVSTGALVTYALNGNVPAAIETCVVEAVRPEARELTPEEENSVEAFVFETEEAKENTPQADSEEDIARMSALLASGRLGRGSLRLYNLGLKHGWNNEKVDRLASIVMSRQAAVHAQAATKAPAAPAITVPVAPAANATDRTRFAAPKGLCSPVDPAAVLAALDGMGAPEESSDADVLAALDDMDAPEEDPAEREKRIKAAFCKFESSVQKMDARIRKMAAIAEYQNPGSPAMRYHQSKIKLFDGASNGRGDQKTGSGTGVRVVKWTAGKPKLMFAWRWGHCSDAEVQEALKRFENRASKHVADLARSMGIGAK